jgi:hydrogenase maturation protease
MMADDGIGHQVISRLKNKGIPQGVRLIAVHGDVLALTSLWRGEPSVWLVDAVNSNRPAGTLSQLEHQDLLELPAVGFSVHSLALGENLRWMVHARPELAAVGFRLYGIEAGCVRPGRGLTREVEGPVDRLVAKLRTAIHEVSSKKVVLHARIQRRS